MSAEKICTLSIDHAIRIAKIIATAPVERLPMITQLFQQASVDLEGLEELIENTALSAQGSLIDTGEFLAELTAGRGSDGHAARQLRNEDYDRFDFLIGMDKANLRNMYRICGGDFDAKRGLAAAGAAANQQMGNLIRVPGDRPVQRCTRQDFRRL